jgi:hypothetical protein
MTNPVTNNRHAGGQWARRLRLPLAVLALSLAASAAPAADSAQKGIVGTWVVQAKDAPFPYHMFVFNADGTMQQANPDVGNPDASDSDGKGIWVKDGETVKGKFVEVSADRATRKFISRGEISYEITVNGDSFTGEAAGRFYDEDGKLLRGPFPTPLAGTRVTLP